MFARFCASWLVVLILAPFTAPFSICDLAALIGADATHATPGSHPGQTAVTHAAHSIAPPIVRTSRIKILVQAARQVSHLPDGCVTGFSRAVDPPGGTRRYIASITVLRL
jgi:hypothetical protein